MNIRTATLQDIDQIAAVEKECFPADSIDTAVICDPVQPGRQRCPVPVLLTVFICFEKSHLYSVLRLVIITQDIVAVAQKRLTIEVYGVT